MGRYALDVGERVEDLRMASGEVREWIADYQVIESLGPPDPTRLAFLAVAPARLDADRREVVVHLLDARPERFEPAVAHLQAVAAARSSRVANLIEAGRDDDADAVTYFATDYYAGGTLATDAPTGVSERLRALAQAARGVHDLHQAGNVHGHIGPDSVLIGDDGAVMSVPRPPAPLEVGETVMASPTALLETVDPAVIRGEGMSRATDLWALGVTAHLVLSGRSLHPGLANDDPLTAVQRILFEPPAVNVHLPPQFAALITSCLQPNPEDRPADAADLADSLDRLADEM